MCRNVTVWCFQFGLLLGTLGIGDFIEENAFLASFDDPEEAKRSGLNQFYFITRDAKFVVIGALVRYLIASILL